MIDKDVIDDFVVQLGEATDTLKVQYALLMRQSQQPEVYIVCGQIVDRLYGSMAMLGFDEISNYLRTMKQVLYKCSQSESEVAQQKVLELLNAMHSILEYFSKHLGNESELRKIFFKMGLSTKKGEKLLQSYFFSIKDASASFTRDDTAILVFEKSCRLEMELKESKEVLHPPMRLHNAPQGFKRDLKSPPFKIVGVVVDTDCSSNIWMELLRECLFSLPGVPVMMLSKDPKSLDAFDKSSLGVKVIMPSRTSATKIIERFKELEAGNGERGALPAQPNVVSCDESDYIAISRSAFSLCPHTDYDLYIKIGNSKFVKVVEGGNELENQQEKKNSEFYYISKLQYAHYIEQFSNAVAAILSDQDLGLIQKKIHFDEFCIDVMNSLRAFGVKDNSLAYAKNILEHSAPLLNQMMNQNTKIQQLVLDLSVFEHSVSVAMIVGLFLKEIEADKSIYDEIFLAALIHDIGMLEASQCAQSEDLSQMDELDKKQYFEHPLEGSKLAAQMGLKPILCEAIMHHHQRLDGSGFPTLEKGRALVINRIGELIGIADELLFIINTANDDAYLPTETLRLTLTGRYSPTIKSAFDKVFPPILKQI